MAFPSIPTVAAGRVLVATQADTTATRTFPSLTGLTKNSGDLLIAICVAYRTSTGTNAAFSGWTGGFTEFHDSATSTTHAIGCAYKWSTGSETGTFDVTQAGTITGHAAFILLSISGAHASTIPEAGSRADGTTAAADPASFNPSGWDSEDTLWIALAGSGETGTGGAFLGLTNGPASYTDYAETAISGDVIGGMQAAVAFRQLAAASEDVGPFNPDLGAADNSVVVIAVRPTGGAEVTLAPADTAHAHTTDAVVITQTHVLAPADTSHAHTTDAVVVTQIHRLTVADTAHAHTTDAVAITQIHNLTVADSSHGHTTENVTLGGGAVNLVPADTAHAHTTDAVVITQIHGLTVADTSHSHTADVVVITQTHRLTVLDTSHSHTTDAVTLTQIHVLAPADTAHAHTTDSTTLTQIHQLVVVDTSHAHTTENVVLAIGELSPATIPIIEWRELTAITWTEPAVIEWREPTTITGSN